MPPKLIAGRYRVEREVGRGGMGSVWLCRDERLGRAVAVKQVGGLPGESSMHLARALREARHSAALHHPNVVAIFDAIEDGDQVWLVMEYVPSRTLDQMVREDGPMEPALAARIGAQVADGLAAAHALGTVHRDVKPSNILVRDDDGRALIADFGIARTVGQEQLTRSGLVTGTPVYFSPELARGYEPTPASDVWALGVSLYVAVEGEPPYPDQSNAIALLNTIASQPPPDPTRAGPLTAVLQQMLDPEPDTRTTMADAAAQLHQIAEAAPAEPPTVTLTEPVPEEEAEPVPAWVAAPAVPVPAHDPRPPDTVPTRTVVSAPEPEPTPVPEPEPLRSEEPAEPRRGRPVLVALATLLVLGLVGVGGWLLTRDTDDDPVDTIDTAAGGSPSARSSERTTTGPASPSGGTKSSEPPASSEPPPASSPATSSSPTTEPPAPATGGEGSPTELVADYYTLLPEDTDTAWALLTPQLQQEIGEGNFRGFWATIDEVQVGSAEDVGNGVVQVTITYVTNGRSEVETRQLGVQQTGDGYLISEDIGAV